MVMDGSGGRARREREWAKSMRLGRCAGKVVSFVGVRGRSGDWVRTWRRWRR